MAKTLMEAIQKRLKTTPGKQDLGLGATQQVQDIQRAKTGKAVGGETGPRTSALGEKQQAQLSQQALGQVAGQGQLQGLQQQQQGEAQQQAFDIAGRQLQERRMGMKERADREISTLQADYNRAVEEGDFQRAQASAEQASFLARLSNDKYINELQMEGARRRLDDNISFKKAFQEAQYSDMQDFLEDDLAFKTLMDADQRDFKEMISQMSVEDAMNIMNAQMAAGQQKQKWEGISKIASGGIAAWEKYDGGEAEEPGFEGDINIDPEIGRMS